MTALLTLTEAAARMGWSRRTLTRALERHGMSPIGTGRRARLEPADLEMLKAKERDACATSSTRQEPEREIGLGSPVGISTDDNLKRYFKRRLGQQRRGKPRSLSPTSKVIGLGR